MQRHKKNKQFERLCEQLKRVDQKNLELVSYHRELRRRVEDVEKKVDEVVVRDSQEMHEKMMHDKYVKELKERVKIEGQRVRHKVEKEGG